ncbi:MAG: choice-of-anchor D domain-containing protein [Bacteroidetes bacterium]|nr:choice-of-anchor D domain-containing protein [Bacteroidota bacterium]
MKRLTFALTLFVAIALPLRAQTSLSIVDVLQPYRLTATLLANGHFSISTRYTGISKTLVYQEDGTGNKPVNYTSHIHFKVDDVIFQLPFELNPATREAPPQNPLEVTELFRDTVAGTPRINARMFGVMPDGDTIRFVFGMQPAQRPSGGFIRMTAEVLNSTRRSRDVGVLMLVDTKIGANDQAPIISAFGFRTVETEFDRGTAPGMPEFWLALEGTPVNPQLTARGNLRAPGLIEPDYFLFGNWKDNTAVAGATGLDLAQWRERRAFNVGYTDSAILLVWDQEKMAPGEDRLRASTEIGIVDSMNVTLGGGAALGGSGGGGGGGGGGTGGGGCLSFDTLQERPCGDPLYHPYLPDSLETLYLVTNTGTGGLANARIVLPPTPPGLTISASQSAVIPSALAAGETGVATLTFHALPRLSPRTYSVPIALVANTADTLVRDTICVSVAGLLGTVHADSLRFPPLCPGLADTLGVRAHATGPRCLDLAPRAMLTGTTPDINQFSILDPIPGAIPSNGDALIPVRFVAGPPGTTSQVKIVVMTTQHGLNDNDRDTTIIVSDTTVIRATSRDAEFVFAGPADTLDLGAVCIGDSASRDWLVTNIGGCALSIHRDYTFENDAFGQFAVANDTAFPLQVARGSDQRIFVRFTAKRAGPAEARFIIHSEATPFSDTLIVRGRGDAPAYALDTLAQAPDTLCPGERFALTVPITNPTACPVTIASIASSDARFGIDTAGFVLPPHSTRGIVTNGAIDTPGVYTTQVTVHSAEAGDRTVTLREVVASRALAAPLPPAFGDIRVGRSSAPQRIGIGSTGTADVVITGIRIAGPNAGEYSYTLPNGETLPLRLAPGTSLDLDITFAPGDLEERRALLVIETANGTICATPAPIDLVGRGVLPMIDAPRRRFELGRICAGRSLDTVIVLRNRGNAPLNVRSVSPEALSGEVRVTATGLPVVIDPDSSRAIALSVTPGSLGPLDVALHFASDGAWFTAPDTTVRLGGTGTICGTIWADTVHANVGDRAEIPIHLDAAPLAAADVARLMNGSNARSMALNVTGDTKLMRFDATLDGPAMISSLAKPPAVIASGHDISIATDNTNGDVAASDVVAVLSAQVLLGESDRSLLGLSVGDFAGGNADLTVRNGLLIAEYCAIDKRYVHVSGPVIAAGTTPLTKDGALIMTLTEDSHASVTLYDPSGRAVAVLYDDHANAGTHALPLAPHALASGIYTAVLRTDHGSATARVMIIE